VTGRTTAGDAVRRIVVRWEAVLFLLIVISTLWSAQLSSDFFTLSNVLDLSSPVIYIGVLALGLTPLIIAGDIDISVTSILAVTAVTCAQLWQHGWSIWLAALVSLVFATVLGLINGLIITVLDVPSLAVTLGALGAYAAIAYVILPGSAISMPAAFTNVVDAYWFNNLPVTLPFLLLCIAAFAVLVHWTSFGRYLYIIGSNIESARYTGLPIRRTKIVAFTLSGFMAGVGGLLYIGYFGSARADAASLDLLTVVTVVVLGGINVYGGAGTIAGVALSFVVVAVLENGMQLANITAPVQALIIGCLLILALAAGRLMRRLGDRARHRTRQQVDSATIPAAQAPVSEVGSGQEGG
jgi:rhamnose transport system permease protein